MPCECTNNKNLNEDNLNEDNLNEDKLSINSMKDLSIDEIISLYRQGYRLEDLGYSPTNIESMQYNQCTGTPAVDVNWSAVSQQGTGFLYRESAKAIKFIPTSRCLDFIEFYGIRRITTTNLYVEIREDDGTGNAPRGTPGSSTGQLAQALVPSGNIPTTFGTFIVDLVVLLPAANIPYWIVLRSADFFCTNTATQRLELSAHWPGLRYMVYGYSDVFCTPAGCCWYLLSNDTIPLVTFKKTYSPPVLTTISVTPTTTSVNIGATTQLTATCKDQYNNTITCPTLTWSSNNPAKASVNSSTGLVTGVATGSANITASGGGVTSNASVITVTSPTPVLTTITASPASQSINVGGVVQLTAVCKDQNNTTMTCPTLTWSSSNPAVASVNSSTGLVTGVAAGGPVNITANASGVTSNASAITVNAPSQTLTVITISPTSQSINTGGVVQLSAVCKDQNNNTMTCPTLTWLSGNTLKATVNSFGLVTGIATGSANITASASGVTSNISVITVTGTVSILTSIIVSPTSASIAPTYTKQFTVTCKDQNNTTMACPTLTWASSNTSVATINSTGLATGIVVGSTNITASATGVTSNTATLTVSTTPPSAGGGGAMMIAAVAAIGIAYFMMKKTPK